jgi:predicted DNA-binding transcriptional regulator YafY
MPLGFDLEEYVGNALMVMRGAPLEVRLRFDRKVAPWVGDRTWHPSQKIERTQGGAVVMTLQVADTSELVGWILSFGGGVRVLSPQSLRDRMHEEARRILRKP